MEVKSRQRFKNGRFKKKMDVMDCNNNVDLLSEEEKSNELQMFENNPTSPDKATNIAVTEYSDILQGRRIIDLAYFAKMLQQGCAGCEEPLQLVGCVSERKYGLASIFQIKCHKCGNITSISSGKRQNDEKNGQGPFDVNVKLGVALLHAGIGEAIFASILAIMNIPCMTSGNMKKVERRAGSAIENLAKETCDVILKDEAEKSSDSLSLSYDAGWQKRGSGKNYNSLSGHASMIGLHTKKVVGYSVMSKTCRKCDVATKSGNTVPDHDCRKNWGGSSKAMEPAMAVNILNEIKEKGIFKER
ncbi:uncharacterized protein LOC111116349 [Crassostrea virginica]